MARVLLNEDPRAGAMRVHSNGGSSMSKVLNLVGALLMVLPSIRKSREVAFQE
jgi:hypothetical protein